MSPALQPIAYCTQFNETDLHFVSRLLEEHGMTALGEHGDIDLVQSRHIYEAAW